MAESEQVAQATPAVKKGPVIIAIDGSDGAEYAFQYYVENLRQPNDEVLLLHIADPPYINSQQAMYMSGELWDQLINKEKVRVQELEQKYADKMKSIGVSGTIKATFYGHPGETICENAREANASLIVLGTRGLGTIRRTILGSVSDYVVHHAHAAVCVCRK